MPDPGTHPGTGTEDSGGCLMSDWREDRREANRFVRWGLGWWLIIIFGAVAIGALIWGVTVATSQIRGQGDAVIEKNSADNWLDAQARFEENFAEYESTLVRIDSALALWEANPADKTAQQTYTGTVGYCTNLVADYNADARNYLREDFRASDLPSELDAESCDPKLYQQ